jgi:hypothetical protein
MSNHQFPSGEWVGFYTYAGHSKKFMMDLVLEFKNGRITGEGADGIGMFIISGNYSEEGGECSWVKQYVGQHAVDYKGYREGKGIWGNWSLEGGRGGFHIWPLSEGGPVNVTEESEPEEKAAALKK